MRGRALNTLSRRANWLIAGSLAFALVAIGGVAMVFQHASERETAWIDCMVTEIASEVDANAIADHCDHQVEVLDERTPWRSAFANGDGTQTTELYGTPQRTNVSGDWELIDPSLEFIEGGEELKVSSPVFDMTLSNGGVAGVDDPLGTISREEEFLRIGFPIDLPAPTVEGRRALYNLAEGVRLAITVNVDATGFNSVVELRDPASAARFQNLLNNSASPQQANANESGNMRIAYSASVSDGLTYDTSSTGAIYVVDGSGEPRFLASPPLMWDSATPPVDYVEGVSEVSPIDRLAAPAGEDNLARMPMVMEGDAIVVTIDEAMLNDPETVWPVYVDPPYEGHGAASRAAVRTGGYNGTLWNWDNADEGRRGEGTGYCSDWNTCNTRFRQRLAWQFESLGFIGGMSGDDIKSASFNVYGEHSATCQASNTRVWITGAIWPGMTWDDLSWQEGHGSREEYQSRACGNQGWKSFDIVGVMKKVADSNGNQITLGLKPDDESTMNTWKRFMRDAHISLTYNRKPNAPTGLQLTDPAVSVCVTGTTRPAIANTKPTLSASSSDPDGGNISTKFEVRLVSSSSISWSSGWLAAQASGSRIQSQVGVARTSGASYAWRAVARDDAGQEAYSGWCEFNVDTTKPSPPTVSPSVYSPARVQYFENSERGGVGQKGVFDFRNNGNSDVRSYRYGFNNPNVPTVMVADGQFNGGVEFTPQSSGPVTLYVQSQDQAGNKSNIVAYKFTVSAPVEDLVWSFDSQSTRESWSSSRQGVSRKLDLVGPSTVGGPHSEFESRAGDYAVHFDGIDDYASGPPVVDPGLPYAISVHVKLDSGKSGLGKRYTIMQQDSLLGPAFSLDYRPSCPGRASMQDKACWSFSTYGPHQYKEPAQAYRVDSKLEVRSGEWVHLLAAYNPWGERVSLWQCDIGTPGAPGVASPIASNEVARQRSSAANELIVGRGSLLESDKLPGKDFYFPGSIDNIRVFDGHIVDESKIRRLCQGAEATDFSDGEVALDPTGPQDD